MQCSSARGACSRARRAAVSAASAVAAAASVLLPQSRHHITTQKPYDWLQRSLPLRWGVGGPFGATYRGIKGPLRGIYCGLRGNSARACVCSRSAAVAGASRSFASAAAAAVPFAVATGGPAAVAAAARQTGALAASGAAAIEELQQIPFKKEVEGVKAKDSEENIAAARLHEGAPEGAPNGTTPNDSALQQQQQQQQQQQEQQEANTPGPSKRGLSFGAVLWGAGAVGCSIWAMMYMHQNNLSFTEMVKDLWQRADAQMSATHDRIHNAVEDAISRAFPEDEEPLLPDFKDLNYPEFLPTLVLDFDGVLAKIGHDRTGGYKLRKRPYSEELVNQLSHFFEVVVWNADQPPVVQTALQQWGLPVTACLNSDNMSRRNGRRIKDFSRLGRRLDRLIYVSCTDEGLDDRFRANFIRVSPFEGTAGEMLGDTELGDLINFLKHCSLSPEDVRQSISRYGGGEDGGVGRRYDAAKKAQETKASQRRNIGRFFGISSSQGQGGAPGFLPSPQQSAALGAKGGPFSSGALR